MLTSVEAINWNSDSLELPLGGGSQYIIKNIDGLGPAKGNIITNKYVGMPGGLYQASNTESRNIVITIGFDPSYEYSTDPIGELRRALYGWFMTEARVDLRFHGESHPVVRIEGYVESVEPSIFSPDPQVVVSIICPSPLFRGLAEVEEGRMGTGVFEFTNPGNISSETIIVITRYIVPHGASHSVFGAGAPTGNNGISFNDPTPLALPPVIPEDSEVTIRYDSRYGTKTAEWKNWESFDGGSQPLYVGTNIMGYTNGWLDVSPGLNTVNFYADLGITGSPDVRIRLYYTPTFGGL